MKRDILRAYALVLRTMYCPCCELNLQRENKVCRDRQIGEECETVKGILSTIRLCERIEGLKFEKELARKAESNREYGKEVEKDVD